ncbi:MAG: universal stress protein [Desulfovibrionales bacterium]
MAEIKKILCAVDFSEATTSVAEYASLMARSLNAELLLLYVAPSLRRYAAYQGEILSIDTLISQIKTGAEKEMETLIRARFSDLPHVRGMVLSGYPPEMILETARQQQIDCIVLGTHGRRGMDAILFGSVAEKVVKKSPIPVLTVRPVPNHRRRRR